MIRRRFGIALLALIGVGCAKFPETSDAQNDTRLVFRFTLAGQVRSDYVYIVGLRTSEEPNPPGVGPQPVVTFPSSNGFIAGGATHFVRWDPLQSRAYVLYRFTDPSDGTTAQGLTSWREVGIPINQIDVTQGGRTFQFELSTRQLSDTVDGAGTLQSVLVNFLTMNRIATQSGTGRVLDGLGDTRLASEINQFIRVPLVTSGTYDDTRFSDLEPEGDTPDPDLDIVDWSIEVRRQ